MLTIAFVVSNRLKCKFPHVEADLLSRDQKKTDRVCI